MSGSCATWPKVIWSHHVFADRSIFVRNNDEINPASLVK
jgi:hypothetical protein